MSNIPTYRAIIHFEKGTDNFEVIETENIVPFKERLLGYETDRDVVSSIEVFYKGQLLGKYSMSRIVEAIKNPSYIELTFHSGKPAWEL